VRAGGDAVTLIRDAHDGDADAIASLLTQLDYPAEGDAVRERLPRLREAGDKLLVAEQDGRIVGLAQVHVSPSLEYDAPAAKLAALVVDEAHRRSGVGAKLVAAAEREARARGCVMLYLTTAERRGGAHSFYERIGLEHTGRRYGKLLG
jgi:GNAT superfamily N-acetyltransferase